MKAVGITALVVGLAMPLTASAHGPTRQKVPLTAGVPAPPRQVWAVIGGFQDMDWDPVVFATDGTGGNAIDATRVLTLGEDGGPTISEIEYEYSDEKMSYSHCITDMLVEVLPVTNYSSHISVIPVDGGGLEVEWRGAFYRGYPNNNPPPKLNDVAAVAAVPAVYQAGLDALVVRFA